MSRDSARLGRLPPTALPSQGRVAPRADRAPSPSCRVPCPAWCQDKHKYRNQQIHSQMRSHMLTYTYKCTENNTLQAPVSRILYLAASITDRCIVTHMFLRMITRENVCMTYVCMYLHMYICTFVCMYVCVYVCMYVCMHEHTDTFAHICIHTYILTYIHTYMCIYIY